MDIFMVFRIFWREKLNGTLEFSVTFLLYSKSVLYDTHFSQLLSQSPNQSINQSINQSLYSSFVPSCWHGTCQ